MILNVVDFIEKMTPRRAAEGWPFVIVAKINRLANTSKESSVENSNNDDNNRDESPSPSLFLWSTFRAAEQLLMRRGRTSEEVDADDDEDDTIPPPLSPSC